VLSACSETVVDVQSIDSVCHPDISVEGCESLNGKTLSIRGYLMESEFLSRPHLVQRWEDIELFTDDSEGFPLGLEITGSSENLNAFLGQKVIATGQLDTNCPPIVAKAFAQREKGYDGFISGTCHYFSNAFMDIESIKIQVANP